MRFLLLFAAAFTLAAQSPVATLNRLYREYYEFLVRDDLARGELVPVLEEFSTPFPGFYLYYPQRRHVSPALRALVDYLRRTRGQSPSRSKGPARQRGDRAGRTGRGRAKRSPLT